jgi:two-component system LytT family response regulator
MEALIVEDEINNVEVLQHLLKTYCQDITVVGTARDVDSAIKLIDAKRPELVFLDVELEDGTGFDVLKGIGDFTPRVIFITGYQHYAIEAIKMAAIDYILKPVNINELKSAIEKTKAIQSETQAFELLQRKIKDLEPSFIWLNDNKKSQKIDVTHIEYIKADTVYSEVYIDSGKVRFTSLSLSHFEEKLSENGFFRIHKSYLVNLKKILEVESGRGGHALMSSGAKLPIAYRRKTMLKQLLSQN